ncbi:integrase arm-type DNA-binding domain-containing protein [Variovorax sp. IB41]|uniref:integrase arm-type DNA-binding domain-containing protein n=1 Tax=Variovorax sp. IB41 TaxID=2779370 RepID=UPI0018E82ECA|nr:integrase family protein [Variovorax sp. IB41]MBJ2154568.1 integrase family protein [Variovorax sp. IB41]
MTTATINALKPGKLLADGAIRPGAGSLKIRKRVTAGGVVCEWIFEWSRAGKTARQSVGRYSPVESPDALTLSQARAEAGRLQSLIKAGEDPLARRDAERHAARLRVDAEKEQIKHANEKNLSALLAAYVESLRLKHKTDSAYDAENIFANHVSKPFPGIASLPAADIQPQHISMILARLVGPEVEHKKGRTALKLRSYAGAAYKMALGAGIDPMAPAAAKEFGLTFNPVAAVPVTKMAAAFNRAGNRVLGADELRHYLAHVTALETDLPRLALQLQIVTGGQRMQQLLRLTHANVTDKSVNLYDPKGKRLQPRLHTLPVLPEIEEILVALMLLNPPANEESEAEAALFRSRDSIVALESISNTVQGISDAMLAQELTDTPFRAGDIRRTIETVLSETLMVSKDVRAQLLSHGLSGVQDRHYDKGKHLAAKTNALRLWNDYVADLCLDRPSQAGTHLERTNTVANE